jgi:hypothetical protein
VNRGPSWERRCDPYSDTSHRTVVFKSVFSNNVLQDKQVDQVYSNTLTVLMVIPSRGWRQSACMPLRSGKCLIGRNGARIEHKPLRSSALEVVFQR